MKRLLVSVAAALMLAAVSVSASSGSWGDECNDKFGLWKWICITKNKLSGDYDLIPQCTDNCPEKFNPSQRDTDSDGSGDACDDNAGDKDWDGVADVEDNCLSKYNPSQRDTDEDGKGDACDWNRKDVDWDGIKNSQDNCVWAYNPTQANDDGDKCGNPCDKCCKNILTIKMYELTGTCPWIA